MIHPPSLLYSAVYLSSCPWVDFRPIQPASGSQADFRARIKTSLYQVIGSPVRAPAAQVHRRTGGHSNAPPGSTPLVQSPRNGTMVDMQYGGCDIRSGTKLYWRDITGVTLPIRAIEWPPKYVYQNVRAIHHLVSAREPWLSVCPEPWPRVHPNLNPLCVKPDPNLYPKPCVGFR